MFSVTPSAAQEILSAAARSDAAGMALRVAARQVADGSIEYGMGFDDVREDDSPATFDGLTVLVGGPSQPLLEGTVLDYVEMAPGRFDFVFVPAREPVVAGCGAPATSPRAGCGSGGCSSGRCGG
jgi:iron-sulfur cluster assembly protein